MENFNLDGDVIDYPDQYLRLLILKPDQSFLDENLARQEIYDKLLKSQYLFTNSLSCRIQNILFGIGRYDLCYQAINSEGSNWCPSIFSEQDETNMSDYERMYYLILKLKYTRAPNVLFDIVQIPNFYYLDTISDVIDMSNYTPEEQMLLIDDIFNHTSYEEFLYNVIIQLRDPSVITYALDKMDESLLKRYLSFLIVEHTTWEMLYPHYIDNILEIIDILSSEMELSSTDIEHLINSDYHRWFLYGLTENNLDLAVDFILENKRYDLVRYLPPDTIRYIKEQYNLVGDKLRKGIDLQREIEGTSGFRKVAEEIEQAKGTLTAEARMLLELQNIFSSSQQAELDRMYTVTLEEETCMKERTKEFNQLMAKINQSNVKTIMLNLVYPDEHPIYRKLNLSFLTEVWCNQKFTDTLRNRYYLQLMTKYINAVGLNEATQELTSLINSLGRRWYMSLKSGFNQIVYATELKYFEDIAKDFIINHRL